MTARSRLPYLLLAVVAVLIVGGIAAFVLNMPTDERDIDDTVTITTGPYINVRDYGATGDGITDDTKAIQKAISDNIGQPTMQTIYFPAGTYLVSNRLEWRDRRGNWQPYLTLQGESRDSVKILLKDDASGFGDPANPKAVIFTASGLFAESDRGGGKDYKKLGEGNEAFRNFIYDLTVDTGGGNPGAIGIDFLGNNLAAIRDVLIRSGDGSGVAGISMTRQWVGPALLKHIVISGFDYGIKAGETEYGLTFEDIELSGQKIAGVLNEGNMLTFRDLSTRNSVPAVLNTDAAGLVVLIDSDLNGGASSSSAVVNERGEVYLRNVTASGYRSVLLDGSTTVPGTTVTEYASTGSIAAGSGSLGLKVEETPEPAVEPVSSWVSVTEFGARAYDSDGQADYEDDSAAVQRAIDSGATTIYFPPGRYLFKDTVTVRNSLQRIEFRGSIIGVTERNAFGDGRPLIEVADGSPATVVLNQIGEIDATNMPNNADPYIHQATARTLVILDSAIDGYRGADGAGRLFLENVCCGRLEFNGQQVWARQLNVELDATPMIANNRSSLWLLGLKTERATTVIETKNGGSTEVLGGLLYPSGVVSADIPAFVATDSRQSLVYVTSAFGRDSNYALQSLATKSGVTRRLLSSDLPARLLWGSFVVLPPQ